MVSKYLPATEIQSTRRKCVTKSQHVCIFCYVSSTLVSLYHWLLVCLRSVIQVKLVTMFLSKYVLIAISMQDSYGKYFVFGFICDYEIFVTNLKNISFWRRLLWQSNNFSIIWWIHFNIIRYLVCTWTECLIKWLGGTEMWFVEYYRRLKFNNHKINVSIIVTLVTLYSFGTWSWFYNFSTIWF